MQWLVEKKAEYVMTHQDDTWKEWVKKYPKLEAVSDSHEFVALAVKQEASKPPVYEVLNKFTDNILFELALLVGVVHVIISLLRYSGRNYSAFGWVAFIIGAYLYLPSYLHATSITHFVFGINPVSSSRDGLYLMIGGIGFATAYALYKHKLLGLLEPMTVIQIFGDVMSYLRLYALGLSGALVTATINEAAASVSFVVAAFLFVIGHLVNIVLGIMGGIIHGLRLNFLEWYHYSFEGGGKKFTPLQKIEIE
jgi:V/A-type H+-transporting ATPase subunit I